MCENSPHTWQYFQEPLIEKFKKTPKYDRKLNNKKPLISYRRSITMSKTTLHFGQLKLLLTEIEFLTFIINEFKSEKKSLIIYIGAAPCIHFPLINDLFPFFEYILVDPAPFIIKDVEQMKNVQVVNEYATNENMTEYRKKYKDYDIYFISDIRAFNENAEMDEREADIVWNNQLQWDIMKILKAKKTMLKFHPPYYSERFKDYEYLDGEVYFQAFPGPSSSETRLIVGENPKTKIWNCKLYEDKLFEFNHYIRPRCYTNKLSDELDGLDECYDCTTWTFILSKYLEALDNIKVWNKHLTPKNEIKDYSLKELSIISGDICNIQLRKFKIFLSPDYTYKTKFRDIKKIMTKKKFDNFINYIKYNL